ncbi:MAG: hypothetical protein AAB116_22835 [Candidatus Poribacteria bacterium]
MVTKIMQNVDEVNEMFEKFAHFHDDYFAGIEIKFEDYKAINDSGESKGIRSANKTVILFVNVIPYGKDHNRIVRIELKGVKSFDISAPGDKGDWWGIGEILPRSENDNIKLDIDFIADEAKLAAICSSMKIEYNEKDFNWSPSRKRFS